MAGAGSRHSKFNVSLDKGRRTFDEFVFDSELEMRFYRDAVLPNLENGTIVNCERQKKYVLQPGYVCRGKKIPAIVYKADFYLELSDGSSWVIDIKGYPEKDAILKRKIFCYIYPDTNYAWVCYSKTDGGWINYDRLKVLRKMRKKTKTKIKEIQDGSNKEEY